jgi:hypothetical protein
MTTETIVRVPEVGDGVTVCYWSDKHAGTIISVSASGKQIVVQQDKATRTDDNGMSDRQSYDYEPDPNGQMWRFSLRKNGRWIEKGGDLYNGLSCSLGGRHEYYDFSF